MILFNQHAFIGLMKCSGIIRHLCVLVELSYKIFLMCFLLYCVRYCPGCKEHRQATKKLDLWRLPEIMVIHMKRFSYNRFLKNKLETFVDFPIHDLELSSYIAHQDGQSSCRYMLYAISNHYGSMGGGHYTAFVRVSYYVVCNNSI